VDKPGDADAFPEVRVVGGLGCELIAQLAAFTSGPARASLESGKAWIREVRKLAGPELIGRVERYHLGAYAELVTVALEAASPRGPGELLAAIESIDANQLRRRLLGAESALERTMVSEDAFERAIDGDSRARSEVRHAMGTDQRSRQAIGRLLTEPAADIKTAMIANVGDWADAVLPRFAADAEAAIGRDVAAKEAMLRTTPGQTVLANATSGVTYEPSPWITDVVIVPALALRPFVVPVDHRHTAVFLCSVADEALDDDDEAPPRRLVKLAAALGDDLRLRVLRLLTEDDLNASEIADRLAVDRTTLHHHLGILRSAGLLTVRDEGATGWRYALRDDRLAGINQDLDSYLRSDSSTSEDRP